LNTPQTPCFSGPFVVLQKYSLNICMSILFFLCLKKKNISSKKTFFRFVFGSLLVFGLIYLFFYVYNVVFTSIFGYRSPHYSCILPAFYALVSTYFVLIFFELVKLADLAFSRIIHNSKNSKQDDLNNNIHACPSAPNDCSKAVPLPKNMESNVQTDQN
jgi:hypothetical protein